MGEEAVTATSTRPAFYAAGPGRLRDLWTLLHPPYTAWHLSYVVIGAALAPHVFTSRLLATLAAFFLAVGVAAHAYDELQGRPLGTRIPTPVLVALCALGLAGAVALGVVGIVTVGLVLVPFMVVGPLLVLSYRATLFGGAVHTDLVFALSWGAFPLLTAYVAQAADLSFAAVLAAGGATALSYAQRTLSTPARGLRRRTEAVSGTATASDGTVTPIDRTTILLPLERALKALSAATVLLAAGLALSRLA